MFTQNTKYIQHENYAECIFFNSESKVEFQVMGCGIKLGLNQESAFFWMYNISKSLSLYEVQIPISRNYRVEVTSKAIMWIKLYILHKSLRKLLGI